MYVLQEVMCCVGQFMETFFEGKKKSQTEGTHNLDETSSKSAEST